MKLPKNFTTVTTFSKILALILFITLPFGSFFLGGWYGENKTAPKVINNTIEKINTVTVTATMPPSPTPYTVSNPFPTSNSVKKYIYIDKWQGLKVTLDPTKYTLNVPYTTICKESGINVECKNDSLDSPSSFTINKISGVEQTSITISYIRFDGGGRGGDCPDDIKKSFFFNYHNATQEFTTCINQTNGLISFNPGGKPLYFSRKSFDGDNYKEYYRNLNFTAKNESELKEMFDLLNNNIEEI